MDCEYGGARVGQWRRTALLSAAICAVIFVAACGNKPVATTQGGPAALQAAGTDGSGSIGSAGSDGAADAAIPPDQQNSVGRGPALEPGTARDYLAREGIPNGDIYLGEGGLLHINIVGLNEDIRQRFEEAYPNASYKLVDVTYTHGELEAAQEALSEHDLHRKLNLYSSSIDVIGNRLEITMPDSSDGAQAEIERYIDPAMIDYHLEPLGEPQIMGTIHEIDAAGERLLILEDGEEQPTYWVSFYEFSVAAADADAPVAFGDYRTGQQVRVWTTGMVLESMPAQATVRRLELLSQ
jgi:hypothetical protein